MCIIVQDNGKNDNNKNFKIYYSNITFFLLFANYRKHHGEEQNNNNNEKDF